MKILNTFISYSFNVIFYFFYILLIPALILRPTGTWACASSFYDPSVFNTILPNDISFFSSELGKDVLFADHTFITHPLGERDYDQSIDKKRDHLRCLGRYCENDFLESEYQVNLQEWRIRLKFKAGDRRQRESRELIYSIDGELLESNPRSIKNSVLQDLIKNGSKDGNKDILNYLIFAKKCEKANAVSTDFWGSNSETITEKDRPQISPPPELRKLMEEGLVHYQKISDPFLKLRYGFQVVRLANYLKENDLTITYYDQLVAPLNSTSLYSYQALRHKAGAYLRNKNQVEAFRAWTLVFDQSPTLMKRILYNDFFIPDPRVWEEILESFAGNQHKQATLWGLRALHETNRLDLKPLEEMTRLEPKSARTEFFLVRYMNMLEVKLLTFPYLMGMEVKEGEKEQSFLPYFKDFQQFLKSVDKNVVRKPGLWHLTLGYTSFLLKDLKLAQAELALASDPSFPGASSLIGEQGKFLQKLITINTQEQITLETEKNAEQIILVLKNKPNNYNWTSIYRSFLFLLAKKYLQGGSGDLPKAYFCINQAGFPDLNFHFLANYTTPKDLQKIIDLQLKNQKTKLEELITREPFPLFTVDELYYIKATKHLAQQEFKEALAAIKNLKGELKNKKEVTTSFKNNFYKVSTGLYDRHRSEFPKMTKKEFIKTINDLLMTAEKDGGKAYFQLGNGFFHFPFWRFYHEPINSWGGSRFTTHPSFEGYYPVEKYFLQDVEKNGPYRVLGREYLGDPDNNRSLALQFYDKAMTQTQDRELAARSCFMAAAAQKEFAYGRSWHPQGKDLNYYYDLLKNKYTDTKMYQEAIKECLSFQNYLGIKARN